MAAQTFEKHRHDLIPLVGSALHLLHHLTKKGLIPEATARRILVSGVSTVDRSTAILDAIGARIQSNPGVFHALISLLQGDYKFQSFAGKLMDTYRECSMLAKDRKQKVCLHSISPAVTPEHEIAVYP